MIQSIEEDKDQSPPPAGVHERAVQLLGLCGQHQIWSRYRKASYHVLTSGDWKSPELYELLDSFRLSDPPPPDSLHSALTSYLAFLAIYNNRVVQSKKLYLEHLSYCESQPNCKVSPSAYDNMGSIATMQGNFELASYYFNRSYQLAKDELSPSELARHFYRQGVNQLYAQQAAKALGLFQQSLSFDSIRFKNILLERSSAYLQLEQPRQAVSTLDNLQELLSPDDRPDIRIGIHEKRGESYLHTKQFRRAISSLRKALSEAQKVLPPHHRELGKLSAKLAKAYALSGDAKRALDQFNKALQVFLPQQSLKSRYSFPDDLSYLEEVWIPLILIDKGKILREQYRERKDPKLLAYAQGHLEKALAYAQMINRQFAEQQSSILLSSYVSPLFEELIELKRQQYAADDPQLVEEVSQIIQQSQGFYIKQAIKENEALQISGVEKSVIDRIRQLEAEVQKRQSKINALEQQDSIGQLKNQQFGFLTQKKQLIDSIAEQNEKYRNYMQSEQLVTMDQLQSWLPSSAALLQYHLGDSTVYVLTTSKDQSFLHLFPRRDSLDAMLDSIEVALTNFDRIRKQPQVLEEQFLHSAYFLYRELLQVPLETLEKTSDIQQLIIAPSGRLAQLSFESLLMKKTDSWQNVNNYLINKYSLSYLQLYQSLRPKVGQNEKAKKDFLGIGIEYEESVGDRINQQLSDTVLTESLEIPLRGKKLTPLFYALKEVKSIQQKLGGQLLINQQATKVRFVKTSPDYDLIHISAHALADSRHPNRSALVLHPASQTDREFLLSASEIGAMNLSARQIVLSACQTAAGPVSRGEGILSLARYFRLAGVQSVVASQWSVPDQISFLLMQQYYVYLLEGWSKDQALQKAKLDYLRKDELSNPAFRLPCYWAAFGLYGNRDALF
ncbi:MAG: CHAT domain-containing protein [Bacteroidota bacterium]